MSELQQPTDQKFFLQSKTIILAIFGGVLTKIGTWAGLSAEELLNYVVVGFPVLMGFARELTAGGLKWLPKGLGGQSNNTSNSPFAISLLAVLLTIGVLGGISGCGATLGDLKPSSESSRMASGTEDNTLMISVTRHWYRELCHPKATTQAQQDACFDQKEFMLDQIELALGPMQARKRAQVKPILSGIKDELLEAGTDEQDKRMAGWLE